MRCHITFKTSIYLRNTIYCTITKKPENKNHWVIYSVISVSRLYAKGTIIFQSPESTLDSDAIKDYFALIIIFWHPVI